MRKSFPKILIAFFLTVFILQIIALFFLLAAPVASQAIEFKPQIPIPGAETSGFKRDGSYTFEKDDSTAPIAMYIRIIYNYAIGIIGILAAVVLMVGGVLWIVAGGNATQIGEAKSWIGAALTGLVLALTSYLILSTVNPALVNLQTTSIPGIAEYKSGCCIIHGLPNSTYEDTDEKTCYAKTGASVTFVGGQPCPSACCAWDYADSQTYYNCKVEKGLIETDCSKLGGSGKNTYQYKSGGICKTMGNQVKSKDVYKCN